jgi:DNA-binding Lrp family transcriptional regulator
MPEYLVLLKLDSRKIRDAIGHLRNFSEKPRSGVRLRYTMDIFGDWDLGLLVDTDNEDSALNFLNENIDEIPGVVKAYILSGSPHRQIQKTKNEEKQE